jgi:hypothetical protein
MKDLQVLAACEKLKNLSNPCLIIFFGENFKYVFLLEKFCASGNQI